MDKSDIRKSGRRASLNSSVTQTDQLTAALEAMDWKDIKVVGGETEGDEISEEGNLLGRSIYDPPQAKNKSLAGLSGLPLAEQKEEFDGDASFSSAQGSVTSKASKLGKFAKRMSRKLITGQRSNSNDAAMQAMAAAVAAQQLSEEMTHDDSGSPALDPEMLALATEFNDEEANLDGSAPDEESAPLKDGDRKNKGMMSKIKKGVGIGLGFKKKKKDREKDSVGSNEEAEEFSHAGEDDVPMGTDSSAEQFVQLEFDGSKANIATVSATDTEDDPAAPASSRPKRSKSTRFNQRNRAESQRVQSLHAVLDASARDTMDDSGKDDASLQGSVNNIRQRRQRRYDIRKGEKPKGTRDESRRELRRTKSTKERGEGKTKRSARRTKSAAIQANNGEAPAFDWTSYSKKDKADDGKADPDKTVQQDENLGGGLSKLVYSQKV
jgi:hypothetical protein